MNLNFFLNVQLAKIKWKRIYESGNEQLIEKISWRLVSTQVVLRAANTNQSVNIL